MKETILQVDGLSLYAEGVPILDGVSFTIRKGETLALVGESGSGKSLASLAVMRLLPSTVSVSGGDIRFKGDSLFRLSEAQMQTYRGAKIAMIFQEPMSALNPVMSIGEQVAEVLKRHLHYGSKAVRERVVELFKEVAIPDPQVRYDWYPHQLSGGQKQRVMIAMALACEPELLIADEPTTALDVTVQAQVLSLLEKIKRKRKLSVLFITHDIGVVAQVADSVAVMKRGRVVETAPVSVFFRSPKEPYSQKLLQDARTDRKPQEGGGAETLLEVENAKVYFPVKKGFLQRTVDHVKAVDGVSFSIERGRTLALVGESGSGKSSIAKAILSLVPLSEGAIRFQGVDLASLSASERLRFRRKIQVIFQDPFSSLNPRMRIGDILKEGMEALGLEKADDEAYLKRLLEIVEMPSDALYRYPHAFSGGQRQRIGIARALAVEPELIVCDEPTSALDVTVRAQVLQLLKRLQQERGISYLFITHDLSIVPAVADEVAVMRAGKIVEFGDVATLMRSPSHPYTKSLLEAAPKIPDENDRKDML